MKKKKELFLVTIMIMGLILTGCSSDKEKTYTNTNQETNATNSSIKDSITSEQKELNCTRSATIEGGVRIELAYKVKYKGDYVEIVETEEKVISSDQAVLNLYKNNVESVYSPYKNVEFYNYNLEIIGDTLISTTYIDYSKIDTDKLIEIDSANAALIKDGKIKVSDIKLMYQAVGAICE